MSLLRQLWLAVIATTVLAFAGSFVVSMLTARNYMESQLAAKNRDNANSLALSITQLPKDQVNIELQVSAQFDQGQYELIRLTDPEGKLIIEKTSPAQAISAPQWFVDLFPIQSLSGNAKISDGWTQFAEIELISQRSYVYQELWDGAVRLLGWFLVGGLLIGLLGSLLISGLSKPLKAVVLQAQAISQRRFEEIPLPRVPELKSVTEAMNLMVKRLKAMFDEEAVRLEEVRREANLDSLTGLSNRSYFLNHLSITINSDEAKPNGALLILRITDLAEINRRAGREMADDIVRRTGKAVFDIADQDPEGMAGRLNGADFALLLPNTTELEETSGTLLEKMNDLIAGTGAVEGGSVANVGATIYYSKETVGAIMSRLDTALAGAESEAGNSWKVVSNQESIQSNSMLDWRNIIVDAISKRKLKLVYFAANSLGGTWVRGGKLMHYECPLRLQPPDSSEWLSAGSFMPMASRLKMTPHLDLATVTLALEELKKNQAELAINISGESILNPEFLDRLVKLLNSNKSILPRLWLEAPESGVFKHFDAFVKFCKLVHPLGCKIGVEHFGHNFSQIGKLHNLGLDYLKINASFIRDIDQQPGNQSFLKGLCSIAHNIGLQVIAEGVQSEEELKALSDLGLDGATGPFVRESD